MPLTFCAYSPSSTVCPQNLPSTQQANRGFLMSWTVVLQGLLVSCKVKDKVLASWISQKPTLDEDLLGAPWRGEAEVKRLTQGITEKVTTTGSRPPMQGATRRHHQRTKSLVLMPSSSLTAAKAAASKLTHCSSNPPMEDTRKSSGGGPGAQIGMNGNCEY